MNLPIRDEGLSLVRVLRTLLPADFPAPHASLSVDQQRQLDAAKDTFLAGSSLGTTARPARLSSPLTSPPSRTSSQTTIPVRL